ncbi:MAG: Gfo/Idh/MocA family oxidoreductase, partial [Sedimentisphaerales bacterium]|nr:Gfo/Idh/MocA family oxidoreductase [Sedimentisphaerales bacterium]
MAQDKTHNFGIVGAGLIAGFHAKAVGSLPNAKLVCICDVNLEKAKQLADRYSCNACDSHTEMLRDASIDIITIAAPSGLHYQPVIDAAKAGKNVLCEKPLEIKLDRIDEMIRAHEKAGTQLGCIFQNRFTDAMVPLKKAIKEGRFGTITFAGVFVPWWRTEEYYADSWHGTWQIDGGGALMNQSIHMIDMLCDLMGPAESVQAYCETLGHTDMEAEDVAVASVKFKNKSLGLIYGTTASYPGQMKRFEITGTKGTVVYLEDSFTVWQFADEKPEDERIRKQFSKQIGPGGAADPADIDFENHAR